MKKKITTFIAGATFSAIIFTGTTIYANPSTIPTVASWVKYTFNGQEKPLPNGYSTLIYENHTYVPARFVAEEMGAEVVWDEQSKTVEFLKEEKQDESKQDNEKPEINTKYLALPVSKMLNGVSAEVYEIAEHKDGYSRVFIRIKNTNKESYQFDQESLQLKVNNEILKNEDVSDGFPYKKDKNWYNNIEEDQTQSGYVMLPLLPDDSHEGTITFNVVKNDRTQEATTYSFDVKW